MKLLAGLWLAALMTGCVFVYLLGAAGDVIERWRRGRRRG